MFALFALSRSSSRLRPPFGLSPTYSNDYQLLPRHYQTTINCGQTAITHRSLTHILYAFVGPVYRCCLRVRPLSLGCFSIPSCVCLWHADSLVLLSVNQTGVYDSDRHLRRDRYHCVVSALNGLGRDTAYTSLAR